MCWKTYNKKNIMPITADEDIKVIKFLKVNYRGEMYAPYMRMTYQYNVECPTKNIAVQHIDESESTKYCIYEGYHSYVECNVMLNNMTRLTSSCHSPFYPSFVLKSEEGLEYPLFHQMIGLVPFMCVVPKGTRYYINECNEIVSETIIVKKPHDIIFPLHSLDSKPIIAYKALVAKLNELSEKCNQI